MSKTKIAIQGELGAYSHIAAKEFFKDLDVKTCMTFEEAFKTAFENATEHLNSGEVFKHLTKIQSN